MTAFERDELETDELKTDELKVHELEMEEHMFAERRITIPEDGNGKRVDKFLAEALPEFSRSYLQKLLKDGQVLANGREVKPNYKLSTDEILSVSLPENEDLNVEPEDLPVEVLYEDSDIILVNKGKGMVVHPAAGHNKGTLVNFLLYHCKGELSGINGVLRPGIVHRIDKDTTGVLIACKNDKAHRALAEQLKEHTIIRKYRAIVLGLLPKEEGTIHTAIGRHPTDRKKMSVHCKNGKDAITHYRVLQRFPNYTYVECQLETGRTHQIRVHMASIGHPLLGDTVYGPEKSKYKLEGQCLHAMVFGFIHPSTGEYMEFEAPLPAYFQKLLSIL